METNVRVHTTSVLEHRYANFVFQYALASVVPLIVSAAVAERVRFESYLIFSALCSGAFIYSTCTCTHTVINLNSFNVSSCSLYAE